MVARFLPTFSGIETTEADKKKYAAPMKWDVKLTKDMSSENKEEVCGTYEMGCQVEQGYEFRK